ncbi:hypothetical protein [Tenacibaculum sp. IB213877]|uniref:hypothetical protein n=1 Tax=Tenacibaculum sp. IB213877 TaxID=3097351 RepID=UPI002A5B05F9|nr:hypothetical protein [Tenacibaculum sp. IB213877]MDY0780256.1 hypothetical protein [Tenacibaculum sp. IB213877]
MISCNTKKKYEDYNENDFYEVQGVVTKVYSTSSVFDDSYNKLMDYVYCVNDSLILSGKEKEFFKAWKFGQPIIVLVHKTNPEISFYARNGFLNKITKTQEESLYKVLLIEAEKQKISF